MALVVVGIFCLVVGLALGCHFGPVRLVALEPEPLTTIEPLDLPARDWLRGAFQPRADELAARVAAAGRESPTANAFVQVAVDGWSLGVDDLRRGLILTSTEAPEVVDAMCGRALDLLESQRGGVT